MTTPTPRPELPPPGPADLAVIQGLVARKYDPMSCVSHTVLKVTNPAAAKKFVAELAQSVTTASSNLGETCINLGFTFQGLRAMGLEKECDSMLKKSQLDAFVQGAVIRAETIGDVELNSPRTWENGLKESESVHALLTTHGTSTNALINECEIWRNAAKAGFERTYTRDGAKLQDDTIHFGYKDGISQPNIEGLPDRNGKVGQRIEPDDQPVGPDGQPMVRTGAFVLGYESQFKGHFYDFEFEDFPAVLGRNGTFAAFRVMNQDVKGFEEFLDKKAAADKCDRELVAARLCGRWRDGTPLVISPEKPDTNPTNDFNYSGQYAAACPFSAHIRRTNPRTDKVAGDAGTKHRIVRATLPYGDAWRKGINDGADRGLVGLFFCANLGDQFEFIMRNWVIRGGAQGNLPATDSDPLIGLQSFVKTRGGAYLFYPSVDGLRYIGK